MIFEDAVNCCHVRSAIYRKGDPVKTFTEKDYEVISIKLESDRLKIGTKVPKRYWKNYPIPLEKQVPLEDQQYDDWEEYDPRDDDNCSLFMFND